MRKTMIMPRLMILAASAAVAAIALVVVASTNSALAASSLVNGNFETGDLSGWTVDKATNGGEANANGYGAWFCSAAECWYPIFYSAQEGTYFAQLQPGRLSEDTTKISQPFTASKGDRVSGWAFVQADDYNGSTYCDSTGQVAIKSDSGETVATPFSQCAYGVYYTWYGYGGWQYWEHTFAEDTGTGKFEVEAILRSIVDNPAYSAMGLDDVKTSTLDPDTTKPTTSATVSPQPSTFGWNKEDATVKLKATDNEGGWGVKEISYRINEGEPTTKQGDSVEVPAITAEGETTIAYYATDKVGNVEDEQSLKVKIDKTAPAVKSTSPADQATNVSLSAPISATLFDSGSGIDPSTINTDTFKMMLAPWTTSVDVPVSGKVSYDEASKTTTFTPDSPLAKGTMYMATVYGNWGYTSWRGLGDKANNKLYYSYSWVFTVDDSASNITIAAPENLTATLGGTTTRPQISLKWTDKSGNEDKFVVERSEDNGQNWKGLTSSLGANTTSYTDKTVRGGKTYTYRVKATKGSDSSAYSNTVSVTTK